MHACTWLVIYASIQCTRDMVGILKDMHNSYEHAYMFALMFAYIYAVQDVCVCALSHALVHLCICVSLVMYACMLAMLINNAR